MLSTIVTTVVMVTTGRAGFVVVGTAGVKAGLLELPPPAPEPSTFCASLGSLHPTEAPAEFVIGKARHFWSPEHASSWKATPLHLAIWPLIQASCEPEQADCGVRVAYRSLRFFAWERLSA